MQLVSIFLSLPLLSPNILLYILFSYSIYILTLGSYTVSHPIKIAGEIIDLYVLIFRLLSLLSEIFLTILQ